MERLQTLGDNYTKVEGVSDTQRGEAIGNGWTVDVIAHILSYIPKEEQEKNMELRIEKLTLPEVINFNFEELRKEVAERTANYAGLVYNEDQIKEAKKDVANLRKFTKALSDERIRVKKEILKPYDAFECKVKELTDIVNGAIDNISVQIDAAETKRKNEKLAAIREYFANRPAIEGFENLRLEQIFDSKWLNASVSMKSIEEEISNRCGQIKEDLATLANLPEFGFEAIEAYKSTLNLNNALNEAHRLSEMAKRKAEAQACAAEEEARRKAAEEAAKIKPAPEGFMNPPEPERPEIKMEWVAFRALLSPADAAALRDFFQMRGIRFEPIRE